MLTEVNGVEHLFIAMTTTNDVYKLNLRTNTISVFANRNTIDLATGLPAGGDQLHGSRRARGAAVGA